MLPLIRAQALKPDPLGRKLTPAAAQPGANTGTKAAKKNARRAAKRAGPGGVWEGEAGSSSDVRRDSGCESGDEASESGGGSPALCVGSVVQGAGSRGGSPLKRSSALANAPKGIGPAVHGSALLIDEDERLAAGEAHEDADG